MFADKIMVLEFLDIEKVKKQWAKEEKIIKYPGVKEGVNVWSYESAISNQSSDGESKKVLSSIFKLDCLMVSNCKNI
jgi:uncharacterized protein